ncbi:MAG TPA: hypothetical protein VIC05_04620 [Solirubrobacteraceae bacterium]
MRDTQITVSAQLPPSLRSAVNAKLEQSEQHNVSQRLEQHDATLWGAPGTAEISNRLGWLDVGERMLAELDQLSGLSARLSEGMSDVALLGMGGSSLAVEVMRRTLSARPGAPRLHVLDSTDAQAIYALQAAIDPARTLFVVSSKSGGTIEPLSLFEHFYAEQGGGEKFVAITDPQTPLAELARQRGFAHTFLADPTIGGRYSALSHFGVAPAALAGLDIRAVLESSREAPDTPASHEGGERPAGVWLGATLSALAQAGREKLTLVVCDALADFGLWLEQLVAESTGKRQTGILPVAQEPLGEAEIYGPDRVFAYLPDITAPAHGTHERVLALARAGHPVITIPTRGAGDLGRLFLLSELAVAVAGWGLSINPFDQPNVAQAKDATKRVLERYEHDGELPRVPDAGEVELRALLDAAPPSYVAIMGYLNPSAEFDAAVAELRVALRELTGVAVTFGYGPRYLHSTGQYHKGGPRHGRFLQLLHDGPNDVQIPGHPYTFTTLKNAQAIGDLQTLRELSLPAQRLRLEGDDPAGALRRLTTQIKEML